MNYEKEFSSVESGGPDEYRETLKTIRNIDTILEEENKNWNSEELEDHLLATFKKAGEEALNANKGIIYTTLSGGIDSTLSLALLRKSLGPGVKIVTFTMGGDANHPDIKYARLASKKYNTEHHEFIPTADDIQSSLGDFKTDRPDEDLKKAVKKGDFDVFLLYKYISSFKPKTVIVHDGIDEQMGGYWAHQKDISKEERKEIFRDLWQRLELEHLESLIKSSQRFSVHLLLPYLDEKLVNFIAKIPVEDRASNNIGKKPLKRIASRLGVPAGIIYRPKRGAIGMLEKEELRKEQIKRREEQKKEQD